MKYFKEFVIIKGLLNIWIYDKKDNDIIKSEYDINKDIIYRNDDKMFDNLDNKDVSIIMNKLNFI